MIKAEELRIGNYILDDENKIVKVECIESKYFNDYDGGNEFPIKFSDKDLNIKMCDIISCNGILLSEGILLKCGFESGTDDVNHWWFTKGDININYSSWIGKFEWEWQDIEIQYLHQLQNLYFSLTLTELQFKT